MEKHKGGHSSPCSSVIFCVVLNSATIFIPSPVRFGCCAPQPPLFFTGSSVSCSCSRSSPWSKPFLSSKHLAREVDDSVPRDRGLYIGNTASLIRASEYTSKLNLSCDPRICSKVLWNVERLRNQFPSVTPPSQASDVT